MRGKILICFPQTQHNAHTMTPRLKVFNSDDGYFSNFPLNSRDLVGVFASGSVTNLVAFVASRLLLARTGQD